MDLTGGIYLFSDGIDVLVHQRLLTVAPALAAVAAPLAIVYPLVGLSQIIVLGLDIIVRRIAIGLRPRLEVTS